MNNQTTPVKKRRKTYLKCQVLAAIDFLVEHGVFETKKIANENIKMYARPIYKKQFKQ